jgi:hypothetical protein
VTGADLSPWRADRGELIGGNGSPSVWSTLGVGDGFWEALGEQALRERRRGSKPGGSPVGAAGRPRATPARRRAGARVARCLT